METLWAFACPRVEMVSSTKILALAITEQLVYLCMLGLGIYFIYQGQVLQKFHLMRTNFAVYRERIFEPPSIMTGFYPFNGDLKLGRDFNLSYRSLTHPYNTSIANLTLGQQNNAQDSPLEVDLE